MTKTDRRLNQLLQANKIRLQDAVILVSGRHTDKREQSRIIQENLSKGVSVFKVSTASIWARPKAVIYSIYKFIKKTEGRAVVVTHNVTKYRNNRPDHYRRLHRLRPEDLQRLDIKGRIDGGLTALLNESDSKLKPLHVIAMKPSEQRGI